jgi:2'-hydroxyisoflavone reductase
MNVLIIGGTRFVGRHIVDALIERGHRVTLFNRGVSNASAFEDVEQVHGDRARDLHLLDGRTWDVVVDACGYTPDVVEQSARYFAERTARYIFISTISVYDFNAATARIDEDSKLAVLPAGADRSTVTPESYGPLKVLCEEVVRSTYRHRASIVRPGLVAGPHDPTDRFTYWPVRMEAGGTVLAPESAEHPVQYIDARDLAHFTVRLLESADSGTYNAVTPPGAVTFGELLEACGRAAASGVRIQWVNGGFLEAHGVQPWADLPMWIPAGSQFAAHLSVSGARALVRGLQPRSVAETVRDTLAWAKLTGRRMGELKAGLSPAREAELLQEYQRQLTAAVE